MKHNFNSLTFFTVSWFAFVGRESLSWAPNFPACLCRVSQTTRPYCPHPEMVHITSYIGSSAWVPRNCSLFRGINWGHWAPFHIWFAHWQSFTSKTDSPNLKSGQKTWTVSWQKNQDSSPGNMPGLLGQLTSQHPIPWNRVPSRHRLGIPESDSADT